MSTTTTELICRCQHCPQEMSFDPARVGETIDCPACGMETTLYRPALPKVSPVALLPAWSPPATPLPLPPEPPRLDELDRKRNRLLNAWVCQQCGFIGKMKVESRAAVMAGLWLLGLFVLVLFPILGAVVLLVAFVFTLWRMCAKTSRTCPLCGCGEVIPGRSPRGLQLIEQHLHK